MYGNKMFRFNKYLPAVIAVLVTALLFGFVPAARALVSGPPVVSAPPAGTPGVARVTANPDGSTDVVQVFSDPDAYGQVTVDSHVTAPVLVHGTRKVMARRASTASSDTCDGLAWFSEVSQTYTAHLWFIPAGHTTQKMGWYWNCRKAWIKSRFNWDKSGYHRCGYGWAIGVSVDVQECSTTNDPAIPPMTVKAYDRFKVSALFNGFPVAFTKDMQACLSAHGGAWSC